MTNHVDKEDIQSVHDDDDDELQEKNLEQPDTGKAQDPNLTKDLTAPPAPLQPTTQLKGDLPKPQIPAPPPLPPSPQNKTCPDFQADRLNSNSDDSSSEDVIDNIDAHNDLITSKVIITSNTTQGNDKSNGDQKAPDPPQR